MHTYIYIYIERERDVYTYTYIYIYIYYMTMKCDVAGVSTGSAASVKKNSPGNFDNQK